MWRIFDLAIPCATVKPASSFCEGRDCNHVFPEPGEHERFRGEGQQRASMKPPEVLGLAKPSPHFADSLSQSWRGGLRALPFW